MKTRARAAWVERKYHEARLAGRHSYAVAEFSKSFALLRTDSFIGLVGKIVQVQVRQKTSQDRRRSNDEKAN